MFRTLLTSTALTALLTMGAVAQDAAKDQTTTDQTTQTQATETQPPIDKSQLTATTLTPDQLVGTEAFGPEGEQLGVVVDTVLAADGAKVDALVIDFGAYLSVPNKQVAVSVENLQYFLDHNGKPHVFVNATRDDLQKMAEYNKDTFATDRQTQLLVTQPPAVPE